MANVMIVTSRSGPDPIPELSLLAHTITLRSFSDQVLSDSAASDVVVIDATTDLVAAKSTCRLFTGSGIAIPRLIVLAEGGLSVYSAEWGCSDLIVTGAGPAEYDARLRILIDQEADGPDTIVEGGIVIDAAAYSARLNDRLLDLTYTEFELLKYLMQHPGRVFSREHLLTEVWGYDYYGGTRTVDVHVRRLRSKLGVENESLISTVRNVGYRFSAR